MAPRRALTWFKRTPIYRYRLSIWVVSFTAITVFAGVSGVIARDRLARVQDQQVHDAAVQEAEACVNSWLRLEGSRAAIAESINGVLQLAFAPGVANNQISPERRAQIEAIAAPIVANSQAELPEPKCDLDRARERLRELQGAP